MCLILLNFNNCQYFFDFILYYKMIINETSKYSETYKDFIIKVANKIMPIKKKTKYSYSYYFDMFIYVLKNVHTWKDLNITYESKDKKKYHYTTIRKMFNKFNKFNIFKKAYYELLTYYPLYEDDNGELDLFIDSAFNSNKNGSEYVDRNPMYCKKKVTKLSYISDVYKNVLSVIPIVKPSIHDTKTIIDTIKPLKVDKSIKINLIGDKGYISKKENKMKLLKENKIKLITPRRKNQHNIRISKKMRIKLDKRGSIIEHSIKNSKSSDRIYLRKEKIIIKKIRNYMGFVFLQLGLQLFKVIKNIYGCV